MGSALDLLKIKSCFNSICWVKSLTNILSKPYSTYRVKSLTLLKNESVLLICKNAFFAVYQPDLFYQLRILLLSFQNQVNLSLKCKHCAYKIALWARKGIGTFEKWTPGTFIFSRDREHIIYARVTKRIV